MSTFSRKWCEVGWFKFRYHSYKKNDLILDIYIMPIQVCFYAGYNIEWMRIGRVSCVNETTVDLYAAVWLKSITLDYDRSKIYNLNQLLQ